MTLKRRIKYLRHRKLGRFTYFGETIRFSADSLVFQEACEHGIYEQANLRFLQCAARPGTWYFDIGANIGLMSAPLLQSCPDLTVVSVEASPRTSAFLAASAADSPNRGRWHVVPSALGSSSGKIAFHASAAAGGVYDGLRDTGRAGGGAPVEVDLTTLDLLWEKHGRPPVSLLKIDVEGAETEVLRGARACLAATRPIVLLEWNPVNLAAYHLSPESLLPLAAELGYEVLTTPGLAPVRNPGTLSFFSRVNETFLLVPQA